MLKIVPDNLKTQIICKHAVTKLPFTKLIKFLINIKIHKCVINLLKEMVKDRNI